MIRAGLFTEATRRSGEWVFIDLGFASISKSCGILVGESEPKELSFSELKTQLLKIISSSKTPLNLLIEAPLSVAFNENGNPTGRSFETRGPHSRYWYIGPGSSVLVAATYLLRAIYDTHLFREVRLFEGFVSFKESGVRSSHSEDVIKLRSIIWKVAPKAGRVIPGHMLSKSQNDRLQSAFLVAGMDCGIPPVVLIE